MNCSGSELNALPKMTPNNVNKIILSNNKISGVVNRMFNSLSELVVLDLSHNVITSIDAHGLYQLTQLKELDLTRCGLSEAQLETHVFAWAGSIQSLVLDENRFERVPTSLLNTLNQLKNVSLSRNPMDRLQTSSFAHFAELEAIYLNEMPNLKVVEKFAFVNLPKLKTLEIRDNPRLIHLGGKIFGHNVMNIQQLFFQNNQIEIIPEELSKNLPYLVRFKISSLSRIIIRKLS